MIYSSMSHRRATEYKIVFQTLNISTVNGDTIKDLEKAGFEEIALDLDKKFYR